MRYHSTTRYLLYPLLCGTVAARAAVISTREAGLALARGVPSQWSSAAIVAMLVVAGILVVAVGRLFFGVSRKEALGQVCPRAIDLLWPLGVGLAVTAICLTRYQFAPGFDPQRGLLSEFRSAGVALTLATIVPACEELASRGFVLQSLRRQFSVPTSIAVSSAAFALVHVSPQKWMVAFLFGSIAGIARVRSGSITVPILCHIVWNGVISLAILA